MGRPWRRDSEDRWIPPNNFFASMIFPCVIRVAIKWKRRSRSLMHGMCHVIRYSCGLLRIHQEDITEEFERLCGEGMNPMRAMWKASRAAQGKRRLRRLRVGARGDGSGGGGRAQGAFAASAMAMYTSSDPAGELDSEGALQPRPRTSASFDVVRRHVELEATGKA